jgi:hypothetical protein
MLAIEAQSWMEENNRRHCTLTVFGEMTYEGIYNDVPPPEGVARCERYNSIRKHGALFRSRKKFLRRTDWVDWALFSEDGCYDIREPSPVWDYTNWKPGKILAIFAIRSGRSMVSEPLVLVHKADRHPNNWESPTMRAYKMRYEKRGDLGNRSGGEGGASRCVLEVEPAASIRDRLAVFQSVPTLQETDSCDKFDDLAIVLLDRERYWAKQLINFVDAEVPAAAEE